MKPWRLPSAQSRVPITKSDSRNDERRRRRHQSEGDDAVGEGMARGAENGERGHVRAEQRQQEHDGPERAARQEVVFGVLPARVARKAKMPMYEHEPRDRRRRPRRDHSVACARLVLEMRRPEQRDEHQSRRDGRERVGRVIEEADRQEAEDERRALAPEPEVLVQRRRARHEQARAVTYVMRVVRRYHSGATKPIVPPAAILRPSCTHRRHRATGCRRSRPREHSTRGCARSSPGISIRRPGARSGSIREEARVGSAERRSRASPTSSASAPFEDEWLRGGPVQRWVPQGPGRQAGLRLRNRRHDRHPQDPRRVRRLPHRLRAVQRDAARRAFPERRPTG